MSASFFTNKPHHASLTRFVSCCVSQTNERKEVTHYLASQMTPLELLSRHALLVHNMSQAMCFQLRDALRVGCIGVSNRFFCNSMEPKEMLKVLDDELRNFCILVEAPKTPFGRVKKTYSGKVGGRNDDVAIVLQLAITGAR